MRLKSYFKMIALFVVLIVIAGGCYGLIESIGGQKHQISAIPVDGTNGTVKHVRVYSLGADLSSDDIRDIDPYLIEEYYALKDLETGNYYEADKDKYGNWHWTEKGLQQKREDEMQFRGRSGSCTNLYLVDENGKEHFLGYTLTAVGVENELWESRKITVPVTDHITIRLVKEMPDEITFIDQVKIRVVETDPAGKRKQYYLEGSKAYKNGSSDNRLTAFRNDGNHISISSSKIPDPSSRWGVKKGESLELNFSVPLLRKGHMREYYVMTLGYYIKD